LHQPLLVLVKELLNRLLRYLKATNGKDQFDNQFTSVPQYPGLQHFSQTFDPLKSGTWQVKETCGIIRTLAAKCAPILSAQKMTEELCGKKPLMKLEMRALRALCELSLLISQHNHSDLCITARDDARKIV